MPTASAQRPAVSMRNISKSFGTLKALQDVSLTLKSGEIHALIGENGAGKTTLMRILYGMDLPDTGTIELDGRPRVIDSPQNAIRLGIGMVHQRLKLLPSLTVLENIVLGVEPQKHGFLDHETARQRIREITKSFPFKTDLDIPVGSLPIGLQQRVEIIKVLYRGARILIFDEPTSVLTPQETEDLFSILATLRDAGKSIIYISHKLWEVLRISDRITVLRRGVVQGVLPTSQATTDALTRMMVGQELVPLEHSQRATRSTIVLSLADIDVRDNTGMRAIKNLTLHVRAGEIIGIAGVEGNGQRELAEIIVGTRLPAAGQIRMMNVDITHLPVAKRRELGLAFIPEDRDREGVIGDFSIAENLISSRLTKPPVSRWGILQPRAIQDMACNLIDRFSIRGGGPATRARHLSGGNIQKVVVARELIGTPRVILACHPSRGIDVNATRFIHQELLRLRDEGCAILLISGDLDEIFTLSDRIVTLYEGRITGDFPARRTSREKVGLAMLGMPKATAI